MNAAEFRDAMHRLGFKDYKATAKALRMGKWGYQTVGKWARDEQPIPGPVQVAIELMLEQAEFVKIERAE